MRTDLIPPLGFVPVYTKSYIFGTVDGNGKETIVFTSILPDNAPEWLVPDAEELGFTTAKMMKKTIQSFDSSASGTDYLEIPHTSIPRDQSYLGAWRYEPNTDIGNGAKGIGINTATAKELHKDLIRLSRKPKLMQLDIDFQRALEAGSDTSAIVTKKNTLRDLTAQVDSLNVTETTVVGVTTQIRTVWDNDLLGVYPQNYLDGVNPVTI
tara:strand:+ start:688 stop:1317 length:630 start_codon:yes stop_codon:yes gene_type:complete